MVVIDCLFDDDDDDDDACDDDCSWGNGRKMSGKYAKHGLHLNALRCGPKSQNSGVVALPRDFSMQPHWGLA